MGFADVLLLQVRTIVVVSSWCEHAAHVTLSLDWDLIGLDKGAVRVPSHLPICFVQAFVSHAVFGC